MQRGKGWCCGFLLMSDGIWKEIKKDPEDKDKWLRLWPYLA